MDPYAQGVKMARTYMDAINVEMEHNALDFMKLREFMRGLVDGGPTRSGHRTPAVFVETCIIGLDEAYMRANSWVIEQLLDCGIHGIHMCHARDTEAVQVATQMAMRYPFDRPGIPKLPMRGLRGSSAGLCGADLGRATATSTTTWPISGRSIPQGEMIFGVKIEDTYCDQMWPKTHRSFPASPWRNGDRATTAIGCMAWRSMPEDGSRLAQT